VDSSITSSFRYGRMPDVEMMELVMSVDYEFYMVTPPMMPDAIKAAKEGNVSAQMSLMMIQRAIDQIDDHPLSCLCLDCNDQFTSKNSPAAFAVVVPMFPHAGMDSVACGICHNCVDRSDLEERITESLRTIWPNGYFTEVPLPV
jgi:hypothetical protein